MLSEAMRSYVAGAAETARRWSVPLSIPADADDSRAASMIRAALLNAADAAAVHPGSAFYPDDHEWSHGGIRGLTRARVEQEMVVARDPLAQAPEEWGIAARVVAGQVCFDVPIAMDLDQTAALNIMALMEGRESVFVDVQGIAAAFPSDSMKVGLWAANWGTMREEGLLGTLAMDVAMDFRRPAVWDLLRARLSELAPEPLPVFTPEDFYARFARSTRYDGTLMRSTRAMVRGVAKSKCEPMTTAWAEWFPTVRDMLGMIGDAQPMSGMSVVLNFVVEEPLADSSESAWKAVGYHNVAVACGLHPLSAIRVLDLVLDDPDPFHDLPSSGDLRHVLAGASVIQDSMLSTLRVSLSGRTSAYDMMAAADAGSAASAEPETIPF